MIYKYTDDETKLEMIDMFSYTNQECKLENKGVRKSTRMNFTVRLTIHNTNEFKCLYVVF